MKTSLFDKIMRSHECYRRLSAPPNTFLVVRVTGDNFKTLTDPNEKPFDTEFYSAMEKTMKTLMARLNGQYAYAQSDEISIVLQPDFDMFNRNIESIVSIAASVAAASFTAYFKIPGAFISNVSVLPSRAYVIDYMRWRQGYALKKSLNEYAYWTMINKLGYDNERATLDVSKMRDSSKRRFLKNNDIDWEKVPKLHKLGSGAYWNYVIRTSVNPIKAEPVTASRREVSIITELPEREAYDELIKGIILDV